MRRVFACTGLLIAFGCVALAQPEPKTGNREEVLIKKDDDRRDLTLLKRIDDRSFIHEAAKTTYIIPKGWEEIRPNRLARKLEPRTSTVLGVERQDRDMVATLYWLPIGQGAKFSDWVRENEISGEYGEEYETLKVVYGADKVSKPVKMNFGNFELLKINVKGGPDRGDKYDGTLYLFQVTSDEGRWVIKARVSYPKSENNDGEKWAEEVLSGYAKVPEAAKVNLINEKNPKK